MIDDEPRIVSLVSRVLRPFGIQVDGAQDGETGVAMVERRSYSLVLLDLVLPAMDGTSVLRQVMELRPEQRVVVCSGAISSERERECLELGAAGYVRKPFDLGALVALVLAAVQPSTRYARSVQ